MHLAFWSIAQTKNRETEAKGLGWELFKNYLIALDKFKPDYFLYENNKSMSPAIMAQITKELGVEPILINSARVSAQNRQRLYWTNIPGVEQPEDKGILLRDILESGVPMREKGYTLKANYFKSSAVNSVDGGHFPAPMVEEPLTTGPCGKAYTLTTACCRAIPEDTIKRHRHTMVAEPVRIGTIESAAKNTDFDSQQYRVYSPDGKSVTLCGQGGGVGAKTGLYAAPVYAYQSNGKTYPIYEVKNGQITIKGKQYPIKLADGFYIIRKLSVTECKRLQTVPDDYVFPVSDTQAYKMLGNSWTVEVIKHILNYIPELHKDKVNVLSMYDGMSAGMISLKWLGVDIQKYYASEIDKYCIKTTQHNFPEVIQIGDAFDARTSKWDGFVW